MSKVASLGMGSAKPLNRKSAHVPTPIPMRMGSSLVHGAGTPTRVLMLKSQGIHRDTTLEALMDLIFQLVPVLKVANNAREVIHAHNMEEGTALIEFESKQLASQIIGAFEQHANRATLPTFNGHPIEFEVSSDEYVDQEEQDAKHKQLSESEHEPDSGNEFARMDLSAMLQPLGDQPIHTNGGSMGISHGDEDRRKALPLLDFTQPFGNAFKDLGSAPSLLLPKGAAQELQTALEKVGGDVAFGDLFLEIRVREPNLPDEDPALAQNSMSLHDALQRGRVSAGSRVERRVPSGDNLLGKAPKNDRKNKTVISTSLFGDHSPGNAIQRSRNASQQLSQDGDSQSSSKRNFLGMTSTASKERLPEDRPKVMSSHALPSDIPRVMPQSDISSMNGSVTGASFLSPQEKHTILNTPQTNPEHGRISDIDMNVQLPMQPHFPMTPNLPITPHSPFYNNQFNNLLNTPRGSASSAGLFQPRAPLTPNEYGTSRMSPGPVGNHFVNPNVLSNILGGSLPNPGVWPNQGQPSVTGAADARAAMQGVTMQTMNGYQLQQSAGNISLSSGGPNNTEGISIVNPSLLNSNTPVVMINNLNEDETDCNRLFNLCGVFGDVIRVKISYHRRDTAFVQMANHRQAKFVVQCLDRVQLYGKIIHVSLSRMNRVKLPKDSPNSALLYPDAKFLTKDFTVSKYHRFSRRNGKSNPTQIGQPSQILHIGNLPQCTQSELTAFLGASRVQSIELIGSPHTQAFVKCPSVDVACQILIERHAQVFKDRELRVSFALRAHMPSDVQPKKHLLTAQPLMQPMVRLDYTQQLHGFLDENSRQANGHPPSQPFEMTYDQINTQFAMPPPQFPTM